MTSVFLNSRDFASNLGDNSNLHICISFAYLRPIFPIESVTHHPRGLDLYAQACSWRWFRRGAWIRRHSCGRVLHNYPELDELSLHLSYAKLVVLNLENDLSSDVLCYKLTTNKLAADTKNCPKNDKTYVTKGWLKPLFVAFPDNDQESICADQICTCMLCSTR